jgi:hypothetical protein
MAPRASVWLLGPVQPAIVTASTQHAHERIFIYPSHFEAGDGADAFATPVAVYRIREWTAVPGAFNAG